MNTVKKDMISGILHTAASKYSGILVQLVIAGVLSRLLTSDDFGIVAIATVIIAFFGIFSDLGIAPAIIQKKDLDKKDIDNIFSFTFFSGIFLAFLFFLSSEAIASFYETDVLITICRFLSVNLFFASINIVPNALLYKEKRFKFIAVRTVTVQIICGLAAIIAAFYGAGLYALIVTPILSSIILFIINYHQYKPKLKFTLGLESVRKIFSYSAYQFGFNIINYFSRNLDKLLIGKYIGKSPLGYYEKSYRLMMMPLQNITNVVSPVMHPVFSEFQKDLKQIATSYLKVVKILAFIGLPLSVVLWFTSSELILLIFGGQWEASVPVFKILSLSVWAQIVMSTSGSIFQAANATRTMFWSGILSTALNVAAICTGIFVFGTLEAVAWGISISFTCNFIICYAMMYFITLKVSWNSFWKIFISPSILAAIICAVLTLLSFILPVNTNLILSLIIKGSISLFVFVLYIQLSGEYNIYYEFSRKFKNFKK